IRRVELFVDGLLIKQATYGTPRPDVCGVFPLSLGCPNVGFTGDLSGVSAGSHQLMVRFTDNSGGISQIIRNIVSVPNQVTLNLEGPTNNATTTTNVIVVGWAIATQSIARVEILVDDVIVTNA